MEVGEEKEGVIQSNRDTVSSYTIIVYGVELKDRVKNLKIESAAQVVNDM